MAAGDVLYRTGAQALVSLLEAVVGANDGVWVGTDNYQDGVFLVDIAAGPTAVVSGSNALAKPANATAGTPLAAGLTASGQVTVAILPRWVKTLTTGAGGSVTVLALFRTRAV